MGMYGDELFAELNHLAEIVTRYEAGDPQLVSRMESLYESHDHKVPKSLKLSQPSHDDVIMTRRSESSASKIRRRYKDPKSLKTLKLNIHSPSADSTKWSRKRTLSVEDRSKLPPSKKAKVADAFSWKGKEIPEWLVQLMTDMNGTDLKLIFEKNLFETDVNKNEGRLSMPYNKLIDKDFMTEAELTILEDDINNKKKTGIPTFLIDPMKAKWEVTLKRWEMKKASGKGSWNYALTTGWNDVVRAHGFEQGQDVSVWSFRCDGVLRFALATPPPPPPPPTVMAQSSSSCL